MNSGYCDPILRKKTKDGKTGKFITDHYDLGKGCMEEDRVPENRIKAVTQE